MWERTKLRNFYDSALKNKILQKHRKYNTIGKITVAGEILHTGFTESRDGTDEYS